MLEVVEVGNEHLVGEVIGLEQDVVTIQVYEETSGLRPGAPVFGTGLPLSVELGPGLIQSIFDGIQRPLPVLELRSGTFLRRGIEVTPLYRKQAWPFTPRVIAGDTVGPGEVLGSVPETAAIEHKVMVPPDIGGQLAWVAPAGNYRIEDVIARVRTAKDEQDITMLQRWPARRPRPCHHRLAPSELLLTGQRVLDSLFPLAKGGAAAIPGGFGAGKTVTQHQIAKWSDADVIVYVGCGERGNEMTDVLREFPHLTDPHTDRPLMERTILIANTSNMPVAAREASIYIGITIAEYYRDMGYDVALMADSTSRWAEALREISGRLEEMPAEEGYPAYLAARLAEFYERAGRVVTLNGETRGSVSTIGAVSPQGADFSEPVTQHTTRFTRCFWALDKALASARHFPAINWLESYSEYVEEVAPWWREQGHEEWQDLRARALAILQRESRLQQVVKLVGPDALPDDQRLILETARLLREGFLQQNALDPVDSFTTLDKQLHMLRIMLRFHSRAEAIVAQGCPVIVIRRLPIVGTIVHMKTSVANSQTDLIGEIERSLEEQMDQLQEDYS
jgi:V/A-type H+-transporting ATPase subunit A